MNRCNAFNKNNKKCRCIIKDDKLFCSDRHNPINKEIIDDGCFMCMDKIFDSKDIIYFKCKHAFHKPCYIDWLKFSTYSNPICMICRVDVLKDYHLTKIKIKQKLFLCNTIKINEIYNALNIKNIKNIKNLTNNGNYGYLDPLDYVEYNVPNVYLNNIYQDSIDYVGPQQDNIGYTGPQQDNIGYSGPQQDNIGYSGPQQDNIGYSSPIQDNIGYTAFISYQNNI